MGIESIKFVTEKDFADSEYSKKYSNYDAYLKAYNAAYMTQLKNIPLFKLNIPAKLNVNDTIWANYNKYYAKLQDAKGLLSDAKKIFHNKEIDYNEIAAIYEEENGVKLSGSVESDTKDDIGYTDANNNKNSAYSEVTGLIRACRDSVPKNVLA